MLSTGPFTYNRFDVLAEKAKPDFLDMDKDGDKKESMKKAVSDKKDGGCKKCGDKDCGCDDKKKSGKKELPDFIKKNMKKEEVQEIEFSDAADFLIGEGICNDVNGAEVWLENASEDTLGMLAHQITEKAGCGYQKGGVVKPKGYKKGGVVKEDVLEYMMENNMVNNSVSAEALFNHISDEFLEEIEKDIMEAMNPKAMGKIAKLAAKMGSKKKGY